MPNVSRIYEQLGDTFARAQEAKKQFLAQAIANISGIPSEVIRAQQVQREQQRKQAYDDQHLAIERAQLALKQGEIKRADEEYALSQRYHQYENEITPAAMDESGNWNPSAALAKAKELGPEAVTFAHGLNLKNTPKLEKIETSTPEGAKTTQFVTPTAGAKYESAPTPPPLGTLGSYLMQKRKELGRELTATDIAAATKEFKTAEQPTPTITPYQQQELGIQRERLGFEKQKAAQAQADVTELTPEGLDAAALMFAKTGQLPALGMGDKTTRKKIINRAAALTPGLDIASAKADYGANTAALKQLEQQRNAIGAFEQTASKNIDVFLDTAGKVVDTGSPLANTLFRQASGKLLGSPDQARYDAARQVAVNEIAKITSNPTLSGTLSDSARHEIEAFNPANATLAQSVAVMRLLKRDMQNRTDALDDQIRAIRTRIKQGAPEAAPAPTVTPTHRFNPATGKLEPVKP